MVLTFHVSILMCLVERRVLGPVTSVVMRLSPYGIIGPHDEAPSSSRQVFSVNYVVNVSVANIFYEVGASPMLNPPFLSRLGTGQGGVLN